MVKRHIQGLDGLRAVAVLAVMAYHSGWGWASGGWLGVDVFFVISGYLITTQLLKPDWTLASFWWRRLARLWPALLCLGAFVTLVKIVRPGPLSPVLAAVTYTFSPSYELGWVPRDDYITHSWSLAVEMQFYLVWALGMLWIRNQSARRQTTATVSTLVMAIGSKIILFAVIGPIMAYYTTLARLDGLLIGAVLATLPGLRIPRIVTVGLVGAFIVGGTSASTTSSVSVVGFTLIAAICGACLIAEMTQSPTGYLVRALSGKWIEWIGVRSYSLYLWHVPLSALIGHHLGIPEPFNSCLQWVVAFTAAHLSYTWVERPSRIWLNQYGPKRSTARQVIDIADNSATPLSSVSESTPAPSSPSPTLHPPLSERR